ncbi:hypothetical protein [Fictibacillus sp. NRS-1165]|uniref:hypothetical protein n=1 Tax=Fictibacillus sp. NRS-1165 TaxID=3144463 RepID=UPI003D235984
MGKRQPFIIFLATIVTGLYVGFQVNDALNAKYAQSASVSKYLEQEEKPYDSASRHREARIKMKKEIESAFDTYMSYNFGSVNRYHDVLDTEAIIAKEERFFIIQSKKAAYDQQVKSFFNVSLEHFRGTESGSRVNQVWLVDRDFTVLEKYRVDD